MSILCRLGIHKWQTKVEKHTHKYEKIPYDLTFVRCLRPHCRYQLWRIVDFERSRWW